MITCTATHLRELFAAMREVDLARLALREKEENAQEILMRLMSGKDIKVPLTER